MKEDKIGYISVQGFEDVTYETVQVRTGRSGSSGDGRTCYRSSNNPGGNLILLEMLKPILPEGRIVSIKDKYGNEETLRLRWKA